MNDYRTNSTAIALISLCAGLSITAVAGEVSPGQGITSIYTSIDLDQCVQIEIFEHEMGAGFSCEGLPSYDLYVAEGDLRFFIGYGDDAQRQTVVDQTLPLFNTLSTGDAPATMEWRMKQIDGKSQPFATIIRYYIDSGEGRPEGNGQVLVITKLGADDACHVGYVDARSTRHANRLAREVADKHSPAFRCDKDQPRFYGETGLEWR